MAEFHSDKIRNIALIGHSGEGKTSLLEAIMFSTKAIDRLGRVDDGTTVSDYDQEEISRKISISLSVAYTTYNGYKINILDVPGFFDFEGEMVSALTVADCAIIVAGASGTCTVGARKAIDYCTEHGIPAIIFVNGVNKDNSSYTKTVEAFSSMYAGKVLAIEYPIMSGNDMIGIVNLFDGKAYASDGSEMSVPSELSATIAAEENVLTETAAEGSDDILEKFFGGEPLTVEEKKAGLKKRILATDVIPMVAGVAVGKIVLASLLDHIIDLCPAPTEGKDYTYTTAAGDTLQTKVNEDAKFSCQIFKSMVDPFVGKLLIFKVITGKVAPSDIVYNTRAQENEKITALYCLKGKKQDSADALYAGDIGAFAKLNFTATSDTLCDPNNQVSYTKIEFPEPVLSLSVTASEKGVEEKVIAGFTKLLDEDSTFRLEKNVDTNEMLISGLGEMQLDILAKKVKNKFGVAAVLKEPRVSYRETIKKVVEAEGKHKKQSGGAGQFGQCTVRFEPGAADGEFEFVDDVVGGAIPRQFIPAVEKGLRESIKEGVLAGYPMVNLKCTVFDGKYHPVDSKEIAFVTAAKLAYQDACPRATPVFLEPVMSVKITVPESFMGDILGDLNKRRGRILGMETASGKSVIMAEAPQVELLKYATELRSMTQGRGKFSIKFERYEEVPSNLSAKIIENAPKKH